MKSKITIKGKVTVTLVDKNTGNITKTDTIDNVIIENGAYCAMYAFTNLGTVSPITRAIVFDATKAPVKAISGTWGTIDNTGSSLNCTITAVDDTTDEYTFRYVTLDRSYPEPPVYAGGYFANDRGTNVTKLSTQILRIEWTVTVSYNTPP